MDLVENYLARIVAFNDCIEICLNSKEFIQKYSPEVVDNQPSLMLCSNDFEKLHQQISPASPIFDNQGARMFNFNDMEDHYFVIVEVI